MVDDNPKPWVGGLPSITVSFIMRPFNCYFASITTFVKVTWSVAQAMWDWLQGTGYEVCYSGFVEQKLKIRQSQPSLTEASVGAELQNIRKHILRTIHISLNQIRLGGEGSRLISLYDMGWGMFLQSF